MGNSPLDFVNSDSFRKKLIVKNLTPYAKAPNQPTLPINFEYSQTDVSVQDSPDQLIDEPSFANKLYPLNRYGNEGGYQQVPDPANLLNTKSNEGEYGYQDAKILDQAEPESQKWKSVNLYGNGAEGVLDSAPFFQSLNQPPGYATQSFNNQPYPNFVSSFYGPASILLSPDPQGSDGLLSQDSFIAKLGAQTLRSEFQKRIATGIRQNTIGRINVFNVRSGTDVLGMITGRIPLIEPNYQITVPANPILAATDFILRLTGTYFPVSPIPGSYFDTSISSRQPTTIQQLQNAFRRSTIGRSNFFSRLLGADKTGSQLFLNNTGGGQKSRLFGNIDYNKYKPNYNRTIFDRLGGAIVGTNTNNSNFYVGSTTSDPSRVFSPGGDIPVDTYGREIQSPVYGPTELAQLYEGPSREIRLGANGPTYSDGGGIEGGFTWVSPKYRGNAGKKVGFGGEVANEDEDFKPSSFNSTESTNFEFREGSILDDTQRIIESQPQGGRRLQHVGNAIDQISKVFNDGYNELTKGSRVITYVGAIGQEVGTEYCRVFGKDIPYLQFNDLQKTDGMTKNGRKFSYSVLDNTYNLNIAPNKREGGQDSTNLINDAANGREYAKKYMFSLENLAWRSSTTPGFSVADLPICERGPNGGRIMWFPPYGLTFSETISANWKANDFLGRPEPIYTYTNTQRGGSLQWKIVVDHPSVLNLIVNKVLNNETNKDRVNSILESFFAGCRKYDLYELAKKYTTISPNEIAELQALISSKDLSKEQLEAAKNTLSTGNNSTGNQAQVVTSSDQGAAPDNPVKKFQNFSLYFANTSPDENTAVLPYQSEYNAYISQKGKGLYNNEQSTSFFDSVITPNYNELNDKFLLDLGSYLKNNSNTLATITLVGSASAPGTTEYNLKLSQRRIDSVKQFIQQNSNIKPFVNRISFIEKPEGESSTYKKYDAQSQTFIDDTTSSCGNSIDIPGGSAASIFGTPAMACRRVTISTIVITQQVPTQQPQQPNQPAGGVGQQPIRPIPRNEIETNARKKDNITKRVLRNLLSECDYFETIKEETPMVYDSLKEKLKFFQPSFHSTTPEGLNSRLTFLQQCLRPGDTIPTVKDINGSPQEVFFDAKNTAFGTPPVLVLRVGDFYNTKIIPDSLSISYEGLDLNPEGIGIQPMIANIQMGFKFVGGSGLKESIDKLQNALSFNFYANTEIWDDRADPSDYSYKVFDKEFLNAVGGVGAPTTNQIQNLNGQNNENTIGSKSNSIITSSGETGDMDYTQFMDNFVQSTQTYFQTVINKAKDCLRQYNNGVLQYWSTQRDYQKGFYRDRTEVLLFGKPTTYQENIDDIFGSYLKDISSEKEPFLVFINNESKGFSPKVTRQIKKNFENFVSNKRSSFLSPLTQVIQDFTNLQQGYINQWSRINTVTYNDVLDLGTDGLQSKNGNVTVYQIEGVEQTVGGVSGNTFQDIKTDSKKVADDIGLYNIEISKENEVTLGSETYKGYIICGIPGVNDIKTLRSEVFIPFTSNLASGSKEFKREYILMSDELSDTKYETFKNALIGNILSNTDLFGKGKTDLEVQFDAYWKINTKPIFDKETQIATTMVDKVEKGTEMQKYLKYTPFPSKSRKTKYELLTSPTENQTKLIKSLGATNNQSKDKATWNNENGATSVYISKVKLN